MKKVSFMVPVYNGEQYLDRFMDSLYNQTFTDIQIIFVNDGSTDNTKEILEKNRARFESKFSEYYVLNVENGGAAYAINCALKFADGEYLAWADCDDELYPDNIQKKVDYLDKNQDFGLVMCQAEAIEQGTNKYLSLLALEKNDQKDNMFEKIIDGVPCYSGVFMLRARYLFDVVKDREIYFNRETGQNYQLILPVAYYYKCGFIDEVKYKYYIRNDSHSHNVDFFRTYNRILERVKLLDNVLNFMDYDEKNELMKRIESECWIRRFELAYSNRNTELARESYRKIKKLKILTVKMMIKYILLILRIK